MFLMIENNGVAPVQSFTVLGLSTARGQASKIGQFGSGSKHGILTCLRQGINPRIYLGEDELSFGTRDDKMGDKSYKHLTYYYKGEIKDCNMSLEFGALDWSGLEMGLREFVCNAIDAGEHKVEVVPNMEAAAGKTRVYLPFNPDVAKFYSSLREKFLHFSPEFKADQRIIVKDELTKVKLYRKGVYVAERQELSWFDYNFGDETKINESRVMSDWETQVKAGELWRDADVKTLEILFSKISQITEKQFEHIMHVPTYFGWAKDANDKAKAWKAAWVNVHGDAACADIKTQSQLIDKARRKGQSVVCVPYPFIALLMAAGIPTVNSKVENVDSEGRELFPASERLVNKVRKIWDKIEQAGMTKNKKFPTKINTFVSLVNNGEQLRGFWNRDDDSINLERETGIDNETILHELGHYITEASDGTYEFVLFFGRLSLHFMKCTR